MRIPKRCLVAAFLAATVMLLATVSAGALGSNGIKHASGHDGKHHGIPLIKELLAPSQPSPTDPAFHSVNPGGAPWALKSGEVRLKNDGHLDLRVKGLVIPSLGTPGQVSTISASLYCGADSNTTAAATTPQVPLSSKGNARIHDTAFTVPATCLAPVILVVPHGTGVPTNIYIAVDGWQS